MPIYAYRCTSCGHAQDVLQKVSDPLLEVCLSCGAASFVKQVTAAGFQLKGSGWYVTDFRGNGAAKADDKKDAKDPAKADTAAPDKPAAEKPASDKPAATQPAGDKPVAGKPAATPATSTSPPAAAPSP